MVARNEKSSQLLFHLKSQSMTRKAHEGTAYRAASYDAHFKRIYGADQTTFIRGRVAFRCLAGQLDSVVQQVA